LFWKALKYSDAIVAVSNETAKSIQQEFSVAPEKIFVIYNSVDTNVFRPDENKRMVIRKKYSLSNEDKIILMAGVVYRQKGMHIGLKTFYQIKKKILNCKMMVVGDGPQLNYLKKLANDLNISDSIFFLGKISNEETPFYYNAADFLLNPTIREEGLPIVMVEAMACGLPVVTSLIGGTSSAIDDGVSGFFVEPKDIDALAKKAIRILNDPILTKKMGENARAKALSKFSKEIMVGQYLKISRELIA
jgi:glycosyltransferase involved in cell wall biosynthesis